MVLVSRQLVEKSGINVDELLDLLVRNAAAELTTFYYYTILRVNLIGMEGEGLKEIAEDARIEDRNHFEVLVPRIYELGGKLPDDMKELHKLGRAAIEGDLNSLDELAKRLSENLWVIGTVGHTPIPIIVNNRLKNVPDRGVWDIRIGYELLMVPTQWYLEE